MCVLKISDVQMILAIRFGLYSILTEHVITAQGITKCNKKIDNNYRKDVLHA